MKIYLCSQFARRDELRLYRDAILVEGHECTSRWLAVDDMHDPSSGAQMDLSDVLRSDAVIAFTERPSVGYTSGGRWVEFGFAFGAGIPICIVGPHENIFCHLPQVLQADTIYSAIDALNGAAV